MNDGVGNSRSFLSKVYSVISFHDLEETKTILEVRIVTVVVEAVVIGAAQGVAVHDNFLW